MVAGIDYESAYNQFELIITVDVPPVSFVPPPEFTQSLEWFEMFWGEEMSEYTLPSTSDPSSYEVTTTVVQKPYFLSYDEDTYTFWIDEGATTDKEVGSYVVKVELSNSGGGSAIYSFSVVI